MFAHVFCVLFLLEINALFYRIVKKVQKQYSRLKLTLNLNLLNFRRNPVFPYTAHGVQITPPPLTFDFCLFFVFMFILGQVSLGEGQVCPAVLGKRFSQASAGLEPPVGARIRKKIKNRGGGVICAPRAQHWRLPNFI